MSHMILKISNSPPKGTTPLLFGIAMDFNTLWGSKFPEGNWSTACDQSDRDGDGQIGLAWSGGEVKTPQGDARRKKKN